MNNQNENNLNNNSQANQKQQDHESSQKTAHNLGKGAASYFGGPVGNRIYNKASNTALGKAVERRAGKILEKNPSTRRGMNMLNNTGISDTADKAIDTAGASKEDALKNIGSSLLNSNNQNGNDNLDLEDTPQDLTEEELEALREEQERINREEQKKQKKAQASRDLIELLKKNPKARIIFLVILGILLILFIIFAYLLSEDFDLVGSGDPSYDKLDYVSGYCQNIYLIKEDDDYAAAFPSNIVTNIDDVDLDEMWDSNGDGKVDKRRWEEPKEYKLDDYVKGVLQAEASMLGDSKTYEAAAITARTFALQIASKQCRTWNNQNVRPQYKNPQNFTTDTPSSEISSGVSNTAGIAIFINDALLNMFDNGYYDNFCYIDKVGKDKNEKYNYYKMLQENDEERLIIYGDWVEENIPGGNANIESYNNSGKYDGQCQENGMSLFGAKYLLNKEANPYPVIRVLKYYYNYDIVLKKVTILSPFGACGDFNLNGTSLTKEQFIALVNSYNGGSKYSNLAAIAGQIYDLSVSNNFNPELVITRAIVEGYSGGANNYWGINACNNCKGGSGYGSLANGALAFINTMKRYNASTLYDVYNKYHYAYIGSSWIKGSASKGGCYYLEHIAKYYTNQSRLQEARNACASGNAIATNDEDQSAYSHWQVSKMNDVRSNVFGISPENCDELENPINVNAEEILNSDASIGQKAAQLAIALFDHFGYDQDRRDSDGYVDCSSLVYRTYKQLGINISYNGVNSTDGIYNWAKAQNRFITQDQLQPGDLVWRKGHVEIYIGNGQTFGAHGKEDKYANNKEAQVSVANMGKYTHFIRPY